MKIFLSRIKNKLKLTRSIWCSRALFKTQHLAPDNEARAIIDSILRSRLQVASAQNDNVVKSIADEIWARLKKPPVTPTQRQMEILLDGINSQAFWFHSQLAGLTTTWEFRLRFLGLKLGVKTNVPIEKKSKKNRAHRSVEHRSLSDTIKEINKKTENRLRLPMLDLCELRNAIIHCNPQAIRTYGKKLLGKDAFEKLRGNVVVFKFGENSIKNLSDVHDEKEVEDQNLFGWFLEVFNSGMPKKAFDLFDDAIRSVDLLVEFAAISFGDRSATFDALMFEGRWPNEQAIASYREYFNSPGCLQKRDADEFFSRLSKCFTLPKQ